MGCDFFFKGNLPDVRLQKKIINFVQDYYGNIDLMIVPNLSQSYLTQLELPRVEHEYTCKKILQENYPFNFFGFIPFIYDEYGISDAGQFVFNRNDNGRLVQIRRLPESFGILPHCYYQEENGHCPESRPQYEVVIDDGGYHRVGGGMGFALLLTICKLRWWPDLKMGDDYENCETVAALIAKWEMKEILKDEALDFPACSQLFNCAYEKEFPSLPEAEEIPFTAPLFVDLELNETIYSELDICTRTQNALKNGGITTIEKLLSNSVDDLRRLKYMGKKSTHELKIALMEMGLLLRDSADEFEISEGCVKCTTITPNKDIRPLAQWYLDFTAKIKPFLKAGEELFDR